MTRMRILAATLAGVLSASAAHALDFKSVGTAPAVLYDAPSYKGRKVFIAPRGMPVEVVMTYGEWTKVRDVAGDLSWVESSLLSPRRTVMVKAANATVRVAADDAAAPVFSCDKGVLLELTEAVAGGWVKVRHADGQGGFVRVSEIWGA